MKRNFFGDPQPATFDEINEALMELDLEASDCNATIEDSTSEPAPFTGWTAEIRDNETGDISIQTLGFPDKAELKDGLRKLGITDISEL
jgi:hypothetical protein